jgi:DNA polymerase III subunit gamma/tau
MFGKEFRPLNFESVLGLSVIKRVLQGYLKAGEYDTAYLLVGSFSSGKTTLARIFARSILCSNRTADMSPCNTCPSCQAFLEDRHPGYLEIDAATNSGKDRIQEIKESLKFESIAHKKIILFDEAHGISKDGKDALLKQLEMNDPNVIFFFCTTEFEKMPDTIRSRCTEFHLPEPAESLIVEKLKKICDSKKISYEPEALNIIIRASGRHYRDAENKLRQVSVLGDITVENVQQVVSLYDQEIVEMLLNLPGNLSRSMQIADELTAKMDIRSIYHSILRILNDAIKYSVGISHGSEQYNALMKSLRSQYSSVLFEILDFILAKNRLSDLVFFQSDFLILHHKFSKGGLNFKGFTPPQEDEQGSKKETKKEPREVIDTKNLPPWQKEDVLRNYKQSKILKEIDPKVPERVSDKWGPEVLEKKPAQLKKTKLTPKEFQSIVGGTAGGEEKT